VAAELSKLTGQTYPNGSENEILITFQGMMKDFAVKDPTMWEK